LLKLPVELRATIYCFIFGGETIRVRLPKAGQDDRVSFSKSTLSVLHSCRITHIEAAKHLSQAALWELEDPLLDLLLEKKSLEQKVQCS
jgi:hypothetical protein